MKLLILLSTLSVTFSVSSCSFITSNLRRQTITKAEIISTLVQHSSEGSEYIANLKINNKVEPFIIENIPLTRYDRATVLARLEALKKSNSCITPTLYGVRIPSITYRGILDFEKVSCS